MHKAIETEDLRSIYSTESFCYFWNQSEFENSRFLVGGVVR